MITLDDLRDEEQKAWEALSGYKFYMFGYHAANWVNFNNKGDFKLPNPFRGLVKYAGNHISEQKGQGILDI